MLALPCAVALLASGEHAAAQSAKASGTAYSFPDRKPVATIRVPTEWNPHPHEDGIDGASPDSRTFFDISILQGTNETKELERILLYLKDTSKHPPDTASRTESVGKIKEETTRRFRYDLGRGGAGGAVIIDFAKRGNGDLLVVQQWGDLAPDRPNARSLERVMATLSWK